MSYEILYNKLFLKTQDGKIIPIILHGSNNCYETQWNGRERRERNWSICNMPYWCNYKIDFTEEELLKENERWLDREEMFKYNGKWLNGQQWYNLVKRAIKNAITIEELKWNEKPTAYLGIYKGTGWDRDWSTTPKKRLETTKDLQDFITIYYNRLEQRTEDETIYPKIVFEVEKFEHQKVKHRIPKERLTDFYVITVDNGYSKYYVSKLTARRLQGTYSKNSAKQFATEKEAWKWINDKAINTRFRVNCAVEKAV
jgi:hypothetical protein